MKPSIVLSLSVLLLAGCGGSGPVTASRQATPPSSPAAATTPAPVSPAEHLYVVLESSGGSGKPYDTIAIAGLDGVARAKAHFKPMSPVWVLPDLGPLVPEQAHVAAGRAYYVDGDGVVRSLAPDGSVRQETRFPVTGSQQEVSFAVSPDGRSLVGAVVTLPAEPNPPPTPGWFPSNPYAMDVLTAAAGSPATVAYHRTWVYNDRLGSGAQFVAWDTGGPVATWPSILGTQGGGPHQWNGVSLLHFPAGRPGAALGTPDCNAMDLLPTGTLLCARNGGPLEVHGPDGALLWQTAEAPNDSLLYGFLSPDGQRLVALGTSSAVYSPSGPPVTLPNGFFHSGWIDSRTVAGTMGGDDFAYVTLDSPGHATDLGFKGLFVGGLLT